MNSNPEETACIVTGAHEGITCCSFGISSGQQKEVAPSNQPQFRSKTPPATIEADWIVLTPEEQVNKNNAANLNKSINRISKLLTFFATSMPTFQLENLLNLHSLKIFFREVSKSRSNWLKNLD